VAISNLLLERAVKGVGRLQKLLASLSEDEPTSASVGLIELALEVTAFDQLVIPLRRLGRDASATPGAWRERPPRPHATQ
jgi:hypothetical protein